MPFTEVSNILYDVPYSDLKIGGGAYGHFLPGWRDDGWVRGPGGNLGYITSLDNDLRASDYTSGKWISSSRAVARKLGVYIRNPWSSMGAWIDPVADNNNNLFVYGDLYCWGATNLVGEDSYVYNSGRMIDTYLMVTVKIL